MCDFPYEDQARSGLPVPAGLDLADTAVYMALRGLYAYYQLGMISREAAVAEKKTAQKAGSRHPETAGVPVLPGRSAALPAAVYRGGQVPVQAGPDRGARV